MEEQKHLFENIQVNINDLPSINDIEYTKIERSYLSIMLITNIIFSAIIFIGLIIYWYYDSKLYIRDYFQWILTGFLLLFLSGIFIEYKAFLSKQYAFRNRDITYRSGWIWRSITTVPFNRVQHCEVSQGVFDRYFGLAKLKIYTAGGSNSDVTIPGLQLEVANDLKGYILGKVEADES